MKPRRESCLSGSRRSHPSRVHLFPCFLLSHSTHLTEDLLDGRRLSSLESGVKRGTGLPSGDSQSFNSRNSDAALHRCPRMRTSSFLMWPGNRAVSCATAYIIPSACSPARRTYYCSSSVVHMCFLSCLSGTLHPNLGSCLLPSQHLLREATGLLLSATPWTVQSMGVSRPEHGSGQPSPSPGHLPNPGTEPTSPALQGDS